MRKIKVGEKFSEVDNLVHPIYARDPETYRSRRRNRASSKGWLTPLEVKPGPEHPPFVLETSDRGETHYVQLWEAEKSVPTRSPMVMDNRRRTTGKHVVF